LDLRANRLREVPGSLANLTSLEKLDLRWNKLTRVPTWIEYLERRGCAVLR
jgi:Leucine-rich repeat (LRR) protein